MAYDLLKPIKKEDADAGATSAGEIASVEVPIIAPKKKKKKGKKEEPKKVVAEDASAGTTNVADFSNDFGTDSPRLPSERGSLSGKKSMGMGSGFTEFNKRVTDPFTGAKYNLLQVINKQGSNHAGGSTTQVPVVHSPFNEYVPNGKFVLQKDLERQNKRKKAFKHEQNTRREHKRLRDILQQAFIDSIHNPEANTNHAKVSKEIEKGIDGINKTIGTDDKKAK